MPPSIFDPAGNYCNFTAAETREGLRANLLEAAPLHSEDAFSRPRLVQMHYAGDESIPVKAA